MPPRPPARRLTEIAGQVDHIASGSETAVDALRRINEPMAVLDRAMQQNTAIAEETNAASVELLRNANDLNNEVARFNQTDAPAAARLSRAA